MPKLTDDIGNFKTGDIVITQRIEAARVYHTTLFLEAADSPLVKASLAHAGDKTEIVETLAYKDDVPPPHRHFTCPSANAGRAAAALCQAAFPQRNDESRAAGPQAFPEMSSWFAARAPPFGAWLISAAPQVAARATAASRRSIRSRCGKAIGAPVV